MQAQGWIKRNQAPDQSRFWGLIEGPSAAMFGVFSAYEKQLWYDWIAGDWQGPRPRRLIPGSWETESSVQPLVADPAPEAIDVLIERMAGNRHALPEGLLATQAYIRATGLTQEGAH
jgi:hypothetical protein